MDYARRRTAGLAEWLKANEHGEDVIMLADVGLDHLPFDTERIGGQLHDLLNQTTSGKAHLTVVKVDDDNGYEAWRMLHNNFKPKSEGDLTQFHAEITKPRPSRTAKQVRCHILEMEEAVRVYIKYAPNGTRRHDTQKLCLPGARRGHA